MKGFLVCVVFFAAAGAASRYWSSEAVPVRHIGEPYAVATPVNSCSPNPISRAEQCTNSAVEELYDQKDPKLCSENSNAICPSLRR